MTEKNWHRIHRFVVCFVCFVSAELGCNLAGQERRKGWKGWKGQGKGEKRREGPWEGKRRKSQQWKGWKDGWKQSSWSETPVPQAKKTGKKASTSAANSLEHFAGFYRKSSHMIPCVSQAWQAKRISKCKETESISLIRSCLYRRFDIFWKANRVWR